MPKTLLLIVPLLLAVPALAQEQPVKTDVASLTQDAVTVHVRSVEWRPFADYKPTYFDDGTPPPPRVLTVEFAVEGAAATRGPRGNRGAEGSVRVYALTPDGRRIQGETTKEPGFRVWNTRSFVDPRLENLTLEFVFPRPGVRPGRETQDRSEVVEFTNVPIPAEGKEPQPLPGGPRVQTLPSGIRVELNEGLIVGRLNNPQDKTVKYYGRWLPPLDNPGLRAEASSIIGVDRKPLLEFDTGAPVLDRTHHIGIAKGRETNVADDTPGYFTVYSPLVPAAKSATVRAEIRRLPETGPENEGPNFRFVLPMSGVAFNPPLAPTTPVAPSAETTLGDAQVQLWPLRHYPSRGSKWAWDGQLIVTGPESQMGDTRWVSTSVHYKLPTGGSSSTGLGFAMPWLDSGEPLNASQLGYRVSPRFNFREGAAPPGKIDVEIPFEQRKTSRFELAFGDLPIPAPGEILDVDQTATAGEFGTFTVKKVGYFTEETPLTPRVAFRRAKFQPPYGLAVVVEHVPQNPEKTFVWDLRMNAATWSIRTGESKDNLGRELLRRGDNGDGRIIPTRDDLAADGSPEDKTLRATFYLLPPTDEAKAFNFTLNASRSTVLKKGTVVFKDVVLPPPAEVVPAP